MMGERLFSSSGGGDDEEEDDRDEGSTQRDTV